MKNTINTKKHESPAAKASATKRILEAVAAWASTIADETFELADADPKVNWRNLDSVAEHFCGLLSEHLNGDVQNEVLAILKEEFVDGAARL